MSEIEINTNDKKPERFDPDNIIKERIKLIEARLLELEQDISNLVISKTNSSTLERLSNVVRQLSNRVSKLEEPEFIRELYSE